MSDDELKQVADEFAAMHKRERKVFEKHGHDLDPESDE